MRKLAGLVALSVLSASSLVGLTAVPALASNCTQQWFTTVSSPYSVWWNVSPDWADENRTPSPATSSSTLTLSGTVSTTVAAQVNISANALIADAKAQLGISGTLSITATGSHTVTITVPAYKTGNTQFVIWGQAVSTHHWEIAANCSTIASQTGTSYVVTAVGTRSWIS
jgi:hypothetical protein